MVKKNALLGVHFSYIQHGILIAMDIAIACAFGVLGGIIASFLTVVAERVHTGESWVHGRSRCNSCSELLQGRDLIPVLSWLISWGRCRFCSARIPVLYGVGELVLGVVFAVSYMFFGLSLPFLTFLGAMATLFFIVVYDLRHTIVSLYSAGLFVLLAALHALLTTPSPQILGLTFLIAGGIGFFFFLMHVVSKGRAMGLGDTPIALGLSLLTGWSLAVSGFLFSFWIGAVVGIAILVSRPQGHRMGIEVPFVPFLAAGYLLALFTQWNLLPLMLP